MRYRLTQCGHTEEQEADHGFTGIERAVLESALGGGLHTHGREAGDGLCWLEEQRWGCDELRD